MTRRSTISTPQRARDWRPPFLAAFRNSGNVRAACQAARIDWSTAYKARKREPVFAEAWAIAEEEAVDLIEARAFQVALSGDTHMLMFFLKARRPEKYRERIDVNVTQREAERIAADLGLDVEGLVARAEEIARGHA
jgi:hypothetical protein